MPLVARWRIASIRKTYTFCGELRNDRLAKGDQLDVTNHCTRGDHAKLRPGNASDYATSLSDFNLALDYKSAGEPYLSTDTDEGLG